MKSRMSLFLAVMAIFFCFGLVQAVAQASPTTSPNDPDNVNLQQDGQFGPGSTLDAPRNEPNELSNEFEGAEPGTAATAMQTANLPVSSSLDSAALESRESDAKFDALEAMDAALNNPR